MHADLNGSGNNLKNYLFGYCIGLKGPVRLKEPEVCRWDKRLNRFVKVSPRAA
jgi:putative transposase